MTSPTPYLKSHNVVIGNQGLTTTTKTHKTENKTKHIKTLNEHTYTQANTLIQKHNLTQSTTRPYVYTKLTPRKTNTYKSNNATNH